MAREPESPIAFRALHAGALVRIREYCCRAGRGGPGPEEESDEDSLVLLRRGAFRRHYGRGSSTADANQAAFFSKGEVCRVSHPGDCGDVGTTFTVAPRVLGEIVRELAPEAEGRPFPFLGGPCDSSIFLRHRALIERLAEGGADSLWVEETALQLVADVLESAFAAQGRPLPTRKADTRADHAELAEAAKAHLEATLGERLTLDGLALAVHASPFHLARIFRQHTGLSIHRYLTLLRLRASLERLAEGPEDLAALALGLGFASHSHFTDAFRREFGRPPSALRGK